EVLLEGGLPVDLQVGQGPLFVQDADADLGIALHGVRLAAGRHGRDQHVVAVHDVVDDGHGRPVVLPAVPEDAGPVLPHELPALIPVHACPLTSSGADATKVNDHATGLGPRQHGAA